MKFPSLVDERGTIQKLIQEYLKTHNICHETSPQKPLKHAKFVQNITPSFRGSNPHP